MLSEGAGVAFLVGAMAIYFAFSAVMYRVGKFKLMPGEVRRLIANVVVGLGGGVALAFALPAVSRWLAGNTELLLLLFALVLIGYVTFTRRYRQERLARIMAKQTPEVFAEYTRRTEFVRSRTGRRLWAAMFLFIVALAFAAAFISAPPRSSAEGQAASQRSLDT